MKPINLKGKLYLIPTTLGEMNPHDVLPQTVKRAIDFIDDYIVENEKTARKFIKSIHPEKVQNSLRISSLNKRTEVSEYKDPLKSMKKLKANKQIFDNVINLITSKQIEMYREKFNTTLKDKMKLSKKKILNK